MTPLKTSVALRQEFCIETKPEPCGIVIFGASGDLAHRKLIPSLFRLFTRELLPREYYLLGCLTYGESPETDEGFRAAVRATLDAAASAKPEAQDAFLARCFYLPGDYRDPAFYVALRERTAVLDKDAGTGGNRLFYLAVPPSLQEPVVSSLAHAGLAGESGDGSRWARIVVEKPFGRDLASARELSEKLRTLLDERQIYRIDHYLGKETVQNIMMLRFANAMFEPVWNRENVDHVQITVAEAVGVEHRAGYYDRAGCLRDMFQNHMLQMLTLVAMEPPAGMEAEPYRDEKLKLMRSIRPFSKDPVVLDTWIARAQYGAGTVLGAPVPGYRQEPGIPPDSQTETYVALKVMIDNWRWAGVPFYLRSGKRLPRKVSEIAVTFKPVPHSVFGRLGAEHLAPNELVLTVQPEEGISLTIEAKQPGAKLCMGSLTLNLDYRSVFGEEPPEAYERLLLDVMLGDQTLFVRSDGVAAAWGILDSLLKTWEEGERCGKGCGLGFYEAGSWGPGGADELLALDGRAWRTP